ncbi:MAG: hypothetical protein A2Z91_06685 [Deltaproteobacteria bacterium GWA2_38_16]|nr:MAG: hypothetical protein A2Z91_06685 [Deltaproteobacteria bacterium GWA2_38_16]OGQ03404.1 MAG: hypothetical protein A3D19_04725 [Deltaproteobacteria bacterium RIFCSPHIGHO2_02_FULL_38_15]OGQ34713.1 MAG: hypothetical protein A3A72_07405 [Deltaproteobacteria bacterium RIFCSPLOWO2_01_FULL_38_9]HBQ20682.1 hypothetical protein [Deltaproteobacteria bacterium]
MRKITGDQYLMRIFIGESDRYEGKPLYQYLVEYFKKEKMAGTTVLRGIAGFGAKSHLHTDSILRLSSDLPIVIEVVDTKDHIDHLLSHIDPIIKEGLITLEKVTVIKYLA